MCRHSITYTNILKDGRDQWSYSRRRENWLCPTVRERSSFEDLNDDNLTNVLVLISSSRANLKNAALSNKRLNRIASHPEVLCAWLTKAHGLITTAFLKSFLAHIPQENILPLTKLLISQAAACHELEGQSLSMASFKWENFALVCAEQGHMSSARLLYTTPAEPISSDNELDLVCTAKAKHYASSTTAISRLSASSSRRPLARKSSSIATTSSYPGGNNTLGLAMPSVKITRDSRDRRGQAAGPSRLTMRPSDGNLSSSLTRPSLPSSLLFTALENDAASALKFTDPSKIIEEEETAANPTLTLAHVDYLDNAAIVRACGKGSLESVIELAELGADLTARDGLPLALAAGGGHLSLARWLIGQGVDVNMGNARALSAAIASDDKAQLESLSLLLTNGADVNRDQNFALRWACSHGRIHVAQVLISNGADVGAAHNDSLYQAAKNGHLCIVEMLIRQGADPVEAKDAIKRAEDRGHVQVAALLKREAARGKFQRMIAKRLAGFLCLSP